MEQHRMSTSNRRSVLIAGGLALAHGPLARVAGAATATSPGARVAAATAAPHAKATTAGIPPSFPSTDPELAGVVVGAAHTDIERVRELVTARPHLARATVDWGFGDWESALGAASHMGRRDIAELLIAHGARPNIFTAAMMGQLLVVRARVEAELGVQRIPGPHGITLLAHARAGGEQAAPVVEYLEGLGDADERPDTIALSAEQRERLLGAYAFDAPDNAVLHVEEAREMLVLRRQGLDFGRRLSAVNEVEFYPSGSPTVRLVFTLGDDGTATLRVIDDEVLLTATRVNG
jgi:hypothetical protein